MLKISALTTILIIMSASISQAQQLNVIQVKGNRAIVEVQTGEKLKVGESYAVGKVDGEISLDPVAAGKGTRNHLIGLDFSLSNKKADTQGAQSQLAIDSTLKFGWNKKQYEYGPQLLFSYTKDGNNKPSVTFGAGAFGTYNFQPNIIGTELIFSGDVEFNFAQNTQTIANTELSTTIMNMTIGPFAKWYGLSDDHCIRGGLVFSWDKTNPENGTDTTNTGIEAVVGISTYF